MSARFTIDGSGALEAQLTQTCEHAIKGAHEIIPATKLEAIVLGGGYGRGEGGVLKTEAGDQPYNDLEFYVFTRGNRLLNERKFRGELEALGEKLSREAGLHVEFKVDSIARLRRAPVTMFSYDLVSGHRIVFGDEKIFPGCEHHLDAKQIPLHEATRLLFNRCTGLLLARRFLPGELNAERADFIGRNLAKAQLALGDVVLAMLGQYHWSVRERTKRLAEFSTSDLPAPLADLQRHHAEGAEFKLHPTRVIKSAEEFLREYGQISEYARRLWLWLEAKRLGRPFPTVQDYVFSEENKCPESQTRRNVLINLRTFGTPGARYPRERLFRALPLLLWETNAPAESKLLRHLQAQLKTGATTWLDFVTAYEQLWRCFN